MPVQDLVEKDAAVVAGELGVPDKLVDLPHPHGFHGILAVVDAEARLEVDGVLGDLLTNEKDDLLLLQNLAQVPHLQVGAEGPPVGEVEVDVILPSHPLAFAHVVAQILQLVLGKDAFPPGWGRPDF